MRLELRDEGALEDIARGEGAMIDRHRGNPGRLRAREPWRVRPVGDDDRDLCAQPSVTDGVDERLKIDPRPEMSTAIRRVGSDPTTSRLGSDPTSHAPAKDWGPTPCRATPRKIGVRPQSLVWQAQSA